MPTNNDAVQTATFRQLILVSAVLEDTLRASSHPPSWEGLGSDVLSEIVRNSRPQLDDSVQLGQAMTRLDKWRRCVYLPTVADPHRTAPPEISNPRHKDRLGLIRYSIATEQVASIDQMVQLLIAARYLQLETTSDKPDPAKLENHRSALLHNAKELVSLIVQLGSASLLAQCDILIAYRLLFTGRFLLATVLSARADKNAAQAEEGIRILHVTSVALRHFVSLFPVALGAAEVLDETIRVCRVPLPSKRQASSYAWYRPISPNASTASNTSPAAPPPASAGAGGEGAISTIGTAQPDLGVGGFGIVDPVDAVSGALDLGLFPEGGDYGNDFLWLLPGSDIAPPAQLDTSFMDPAAFDASPLDSAASFVSPH